MKLKLILKILNNLFYKLKSYNIYKNIIRLMLVGIFLLFISACNTEKSLINSDKEKIIGVWTDIENKSQLFIFNHDAKYVLITTDSTYIGYYSQMSDGDFSLDIKSNTPTTLSINEQNFIDTQINNNYYHFYKTTDASIDSNQPFTPKLNQWRQKADHEETYSEIKNRIANFLEYIRAKHKWASDHKINFIASEKQFPIVFSFSDIKMGTDTFNNWRSIFYNEIDWITANNILIFSFPLGDELNDNKKDSNKKIIMFAELYIKSLKSH